MRGHEPKAQIRGVTVTNPDRVVFSDVGLTKQNIVEYYEAVSERMLPHLRGRPLTLVACPRGLSEGCQYLRHSKVWGPRTIRRVKIREKTKIGEYMVADTVAGLLWLAQYNIIELHTWNAKIDRIEQPDRIVIDLDPGEKITWPQVITAAKLVRRAFHALELESWVKTTGGRGLHVVVPIKPEHDWSACLAFARAMADLLVLQDPQLYTTQFKKAGRERQILIDYLRNNRTNTSIAAYSVRARPQATVSIPVAWKDLSAKKTPDRFLVSRVPRLLRADPWSAYWHCGQRLTKAAMKSVANGNR
jgi:bifunctional non-homologous end joining protein LigD